MFKRSRELSFAPLGQQRPRHGVLRGVLRWLLTLLLGVALGAGGVLLLQQAGRGPVAAAQGGVVRFELLPGQGPALQTQRDSAAASPSR